MSSHENFPVGVNVFVVRDGKLLLGRRKGNYGNSWGLPGGHLEKGERMEDGAKRELQEETSLMADVEFINLTNDYEREDGQHRIHVGFLAKDAKGEAKVMEPDKCYEWQWFDLKSLPDPIFLGHQKQIKAFLDKHTFTE